MKTSLMYLPSAGTQDEIEAGMAGTKDHLYDRMLDDISGQAKLADELGYDSINFTEHHFHIEGLELSTNPVMLDLFVGMQTRRLRVGQLGIVLPASNPIRVAEDIAMLDHMTGGRANAGFARGYQRRWVDVMAQQMHGIHGALPHHHDAIDDANRIAFEECFQIIKKCWTEEMVSHQGKFWNIPPAGIPWDIEPTRKWGTGLDRNNVVTSVGVVPKPLQKPHPPLYQPFASSENSVRWCAKEGVTAILPPMRTESEEKLFRLYADVSGKPYGQGTGLLRDVVIADTDEEATEILEARRRLHPEQLVRAVRLPQGAGRPGHRAVADAGRGRGKILPARRHGRHGDAAARAPAQARADRESVRVHVREPHAARSRHAHAGAVRDQGAAAGGIKASPSGWRRISSAADIAAPRR